MKRFITMILAIAMVITSVVVPMDKVNAAVGDYIWQRCMVCSDGSYSMAKRLIIGYANDGTPITNDIIVDEAFYDANGNMIGLKENGVWTKGVAVGQFTGLGFSYYRDDYGVYLITWDNDETEKIWDSNGNLIYQVNHGGTVVIDKRMKELYAVNEKGYEMDTFIVTEGFTSKAKVKCRDDGKVMNVKWSSSNLSIATVSETGVVTGKKAGKATLTVTVIASGQQVKVPVKVVKNKCYRTIGSRGIKVSGSISYDKKGNLVGKLKIKNTTKKKQKYKRKYNKLSFTISDGKHRNKSSTKRFGFTLKRGKSKTVTITIKKSKLKAKYNLPESNIYMLIWVLLIIIIQVYGAV